MIRAPHNQAGFSLVELMIAGLLGLLMLAGLLTLFQQNKSSFNQNEDIARMQEDGRFALDEVVRDISMAGFLADLLDPSAVFPDGSLAIGVDCGPAAAAQWMYQLVDGVTGDNISLSVLDNATSGSAPAAFSCVDGSEIRPGTDIVAVKHVAGRTSAALDSGRVYLRTNGTVGLMFKEPLSAAPAVAVPVPFQEWEYIPSIYYVRNYAVNVGDGIPTLCRKVLEPSAVPDTVTECVAQGIEDLQVEYGIDTDQDGTANLYLANPTPAQLQRVVAAKIFLLARSVDADIRYTNEKTYLISNAPAYTPNDNFYRRVFSTTVGIRNLRNLSRLSI